MAVLPNHPRRSASDPDPSRPELTGPCSFEKGLRSKFPMVGAVGWCATDRCACRGTPHAVKWKQCEGLSGAHGGAAAAAQRGCAPSTPWWVQWGGALRIGALAGGHPMLSSGSSERG